jgi:hypothetical protein
VGWCPFQVKIQRAREKKRVAERETDIAKRKRDKSVDRRQRMEAERKKITERQVLRWSTLLLRDGKA